MRDARRHLGWWDADDRALEQPQEQRDETRCRLLGRAEPLRVEQDGEGRAASGGAEEARLLLGELAPAHREALAIDHDLRRPTDDLDRDLPVWLVPAGPQIAERPLRKQQSGARGHRDHAVGATLWDGDCKRLV